MKTKQLLLLSLLALVSFAPHVLAQGFTALAPITGLTDDTTANSIINAGSLASFFNNLYKYLIGLAATLAVIEIIWGGIEISTKDSVSKQSDGKERITQAIFGLVLVLSPVLVFSIINPSILNLSLNLPPIDLTTPPAGNTGALPGGGTVYTDGDGTGAANGTWCFGSITSTVPGSTATQFQCWVNQTSCSDYLSTLKAGPDAWKVTPSTVCVQQIRP